MPANGKGSGEMFFLEHLKPRFATELSEFNTF